MGADRQLLRAVLSGVSIVLVSSGAVTLGSHTRPLQPGISRPNSAGSRVAASYAKLPLSFEPNHGQANPAVKFLMHGRGYALHLASDEAVLSLRGDHHFRAGRRAMAGKPSVAVPTTAATVLRMKLQRANPAASVEGLDPLPGRSHYFIGNDPAGWRTNIPTYAKVKHEEVYPGIDLIFYGREDRLEYDFVVAPGADPQVIQLSFAGMTGASVDETGALVLQVGDREVRWERPAVYQDLDGRRQAVDARYLLARNVGDRLPGSFGQPVFVGFHIGAYDRTRPLIIDPVLLYSTFLGGSSIDAGNGIALDAAGNAYVTGITFSSDFPTTAGAYQPINDSVNPVAFVTKLNASGSALVYSTYLGGTGGDAGSGVAVDARGSAYVVGSTVSSDFPTTPGALQSSFGGLANAFVARLNATGNALLYATYLGGMGAGAGGDFGSGIALDRLGNAYVTGVTSSTNFPATLGAFSTTNASVGPATADAFVTKLNPTGTGLVYSSYFGGIGDDYGLGIAIDSGGRAHITGFTSAEVPTTAGAFTTTPPGGGDAFVAKFNATGTALAYSTFLGGTAAEDDNFTAGLVVDGSGNAYITGNTRSPDFPKTAGAFQPALAGMSDAFVTKLNRTGSALVYSSLLGGSDDDVGAAIAIDGSGRAYVTGTTISTDFPQVAAFQGIGGGADAFVTRLNALGSAVTYSSYLGGSADDSALGIAVDAARNALITGFTISADFPTTTGAFQPVASLLPDTFVTKIGLGTAPRLNDRSGIMGAGSLTRKDRHFSFRATNRPNGPLQLSGHVQYKDRANQIRLVSRTITSYQPPLGDRCVSFSGTGKLNGVPGHRYVVTACDNEKKGKGKDTFMITIDSGYTQGGTLAKGNIKLRDDEDWSKGRKGREQDDH